MLSLQSLFVTRKSIELFFRIKIHRCQKKTKGNDGHDNDSNDDEDDEDDEEDDEDKEEKEEKRHQDEITEEKESFMI